MHNNISTCKIFQFWSGNTFCIMNQLDFMKIHLNRSVMCTERTRQAEKTVYHYFRVIGWQNMQG
jgi:hypothetical protein